MLPQLLRQWQRLLRMAAAMLGCILVKTYCSRQPALRFRTLPLRLALLCLGIALSAAHGAGLPEAWIPSGPATPPAADYMAVTHLSGRFVAVGSGGVIVTSDDGFNWTKRDSGTPYQLMAVAAGSNLLAAVGLSGAIVTSTDGTIWSSVSEQPTNLLFNFIGVAFANGVWVAVDGAGNLATSSDGVVWSAGSLGTNTTVQGIAGGNGIFAILSGTNLWTSPDGVLWNSGPHGLSAGFSFGITCIGFGGGAFLIGGYYCGGIEVQTCSVTLGTSPDTTNWTGFPTSRVGIVGPRPSVRSVGFANGRYLEASDGSVVVSPDVCGVTPRPITSSIPGVRAATGTNGIFVAVGSGGIYASVSLPIWTRVERLGNQHLGAVSYGNGTFVACGDGNTVVTSPDGLSWTASSAPLIPSFDFCHYGFYLRPLNVEFEGGLFFASQLYSSNGRDWLPTTWPGPLGLDGDFAYGNGRYVRFFPWGPPCDNGSVSLDGIHWTENSAFGNGAPTNGCFQRIAFGDGVFLAAGYADIIAVSTNGVDWTISHTAAWTVHSYDATYGVNDVAFGGGIFVLAASDGKILTSADRGATWRVRYSKTIRRIAFGDGGFVGVGPVGTVITSPDGSFWQPGKSGSTDNLNGVAFGNGHWVIVGDNVTILRDGEPVPVHEDPTNQTVIAGSAANFSIALENPTNATFQWFKNGITLVGANSAMLTILVAQRSDAGEFCVRVSESNSYAIRCATLTVCGGSTLAASDPLAAWQLRIPHASGGVAATNDLSAVAYWPGYGFIAVGSAGSTYCSTNGASWSAGVPVTTSNLSSLVFVRRSANFATLAGDIVLHFSGGCTWTSNSASNFWALNFISVADGNNTSIGLPPLSLGGDLVRIPFGFGNSFWTNVPAPVGLAGAIIFGAGYFVTVGEDGWINRSVDGLNWEPAGYYPVPLSDIAYGNGVFVVAVTDGTVLVSANTVDWVDRFTAPAGLNRVAFGNGHFVAVGPQGTIAASSDGLSWGLREAGTLADLNGVAFGADSFVVVGSGGVILQSAPLRLNGTQLLVNRAIPVGGTATFTATTIGAQPPVGYTWFRDGSLLACTATASFTLPNVAWDDAGYYQVGISCPNGYDLSPPVRVGVSFGRLRIRLSPEPEIILAIPDNGQYEFEVQSSDSLSASGMWLSLGKVSLTNGVANLKDTQNPAGTQRFYRAVLVP